MKYRTTRGGIKGATFQQALLSGYAPDGGLFVPENLPSFTREEIRSWVGLSYPQLLEKFMRIFISPEELSSQEIHGAFLVTAAITAPHLYFFDLDQVGHNVLVSARSCRA